VEKYVEGEADVVDMEKIIGEFALLLVSVLAGHN
jgi:hypothetical protein